MIDVIFGHVSFAPEALSILRSEQSFNVSGIMSPEDRVFARSSRRFIRASFKSMLNLPSPRHLFGFVRVELAPMALSCVVSIWVALVIISSYLTALFPMSICPPPNIFGVLVSVNRGHVLPKIGVYFGGILATILGIIFMSAFFTSRISRIGKFGVARELVEWFWDMADSTFVISHGLIICRRQLIYN